ncbi:MAG: hypothetical protein AAFV95_18820 [Bacteroidota bacterium]
MKFLHPFLALGCLLLCLSCSNQPLKAQIQVNVPSIQQEATSIWRTINDIEFLEQQGYNINLPKNDVIASLITKSKNKEFGNDDFQTIYTVLESNIYNSSNYETALQKVNAQLDLINTLIARLKSKKDSWNWNFHSFDTYQLVFTLYGTGGSYDPDSGLITLLTNQNGNFMQYDNPANTVLHEIVHMGIEQSIVQRYNLPHGSKERIVDTITYILFKDKLTKYKIQNMGDKRIDNYLKEEKDVQNLSSVVETYQRENGDG